jgi:hypothetical protein
MQKALLMSTRRITLLHVESDLLEKNKAKSCSYTEYVCVQRLSARGGIKKPGLRRFKSLASLSSVRSSLLDKFIKSACAARNSPNEFIARQLFGDDDNVASLHSV